MVTTSPADVAVRRAARVRPPAARTAPVAAIALTALFAAAACADHTPGMKAAIIDDRRGDGMHGISPTTRVPMPPLELTGTDGQPFDLRARTAGLVTLLYFGYTHCPDVCPTTMADLAAALGALDPAVRGQVRVVFVSTDPARDTPAVLASWLHHFDPGFGFYGLTGPFPEIQATARTLGVGVPPPTARADGAMTQNHGADVLAFGRDGGLALRYPPGTQITDYIHDLPVLVRTGAPR
ncbi:SCO family protein [Pseudofrankia sp. DC12]|uniref:SCO family protein n=1 Tax=Pseudofrankia sp. DC12 TaxID=683315 RepID=UPI0005F86EEA|nr:SCO family protein [Pseudofrankia sp. DC12]